MLHIPLEWSIHKMALICRWWGQSTWYPSKYRYDILWETNGSNGNHMHGWMCISLNGCKIAWMFALTLVWQINIEAVKILSKISFLLTSYVEHRKTYRFKARILSKYCAWKATYWVEGNRLRRAYPIDDSIEMLLHATFVLSVNYFISLSFTDFFFLSLSHLFIQFIAWSAAEN